jgi:hypothetical protein
MERREMNRARLVQDRLDAIDARCAEIAEELRPFIKKPQSFEDMSDQYDNRNLKEALDKEQKSLIDEARGLRQEYERLPKHLKEE